MPTYLSQNTAEELARLVCGQRVKVKPKQADPARRHRGRSGVVVDWERDTLASSGIFLRVKDDGGDVFLVEPHELIQPNHE